ncbi:hypothetical protein DPQ25_04330 [Hydrogeniiclostridium mannosilyticum]|uniref:Uncharacterized protein n=1 Tax=Hydrogeniiclostridium mannosilyticum TaxID=2764322 RepID=A0A328UGF1_9FIRM|nr:DUF885 family protein [Hydrogeniiclostridium mannosilyticum]RAQ30716.1 hypothetical protein DPQ25_04330 [Hydrogeniiclostridium mannosilyticum]
MSVLRLRLGSSSAAGARSLPGDYNRPQPVGGVRPRGVFPTNHTAKRRGSHHCRQPLCRAFLFHLSSRGLSRPPLPGSLYRHARPARRGPGARLPWLYGGGAIYVEERSHELLAAEIEREFVRYLNLNNRYSRLTPAYADIMIHTGGWDYQQFFAYAKQELDFSTEEQAREIYRVIIADPAYYLHYEYAGCFINELREKAEQELGEAFDPVAFHQAVLQDGSVGLAVVEKM